MDETHRLIVETQQLAVTALLFIALMALAATFIAGWVVWLTRNLSRDLSREGRELRRELHERFEQSKRDSERLGYYLFTKLGPADTR